MRGRRFGTPAASGDEEADDADEGDGENDGDDHELHVPSLAGGRNALRQPVVRTGTRRNGELVRTTRGS